MASQAEQAKVLRIMIIQDGKSVQERLVKAGDSVTIGESPKSMFVLANTGLPKSEYPLFVCSGGIYSLQFTTDMTGKVSSGGSVAGIDRLKGDPSVERHGDIWKLPLTEQDRGKVTFGSTTVLFQFVPPPPVQAVKPLGRQNFKPVWFEDDDPAFFGFLTLFSVLATIFAVGIYLAPEAPEAKFSDYSDRFAKTLEPAEPPEPREPKEKEIDEDLAPDRSKAKAKEAEPTEAKPKLSEKPPPRNKIEAAQQREQRLEEMRRQMKTQLLGTRGTSSAGTITDPFEGGTLESLGGLKSGEFSVDGDPQGTRGGNYTTDNMEVDSEVDAGEVQASQAAAAPRLKVSMDASKGDTFDLEDPGGSVDSVIRQRSGQLQACYEEQLRGNPGLSGRIEVQFNIRNGRVTAVEVIGNTSGNKALGDCIAQRVRRWRFGEDVNGPLTWSWMFRQG